jgi:hypothetical protein
VPYSADCDYDLFVSYAHYDNAPGIDGVQWVSELHNHLRAALRQRIGFGADDLRIFFDPMLRANQQLPELLQAARKSAIFLAVGSRAWVSREFTLQELDAFCDANPDPAQLFLVECLPLHAGQSYPASLRQHLRIALHSVGEGGTAMSWSPIEDRRRFREGVHQLAEQIGDQLIQMRGRLGPNPSAPPEPPVPPSSAALKASPGIFFVAPADAGTGRVLIAQPTDDLFDETDELDNFLRQFGIATARAGRFPQGGRDFTDAFEQSLTNSSLFVQLLGPFSGRHPPDLPIGYTQYQAQTAQAAGVDIMQWRRPDLVPTAHTDVRYAAMLEAGTVTASTLQEFKEAVMMRALRSKAPEPPRKKPSSLVFIDADIGDFEVARAIQNEFAAHKFSVAMPSRGETSEEARTELEEFLVDSDVILFLYGSSRPTWIKGQLRLYTKLRHKREAEPRMLAIYTGPPEDKEEIGFAIPDVRQLACQQSWNMEPIRGLIHELQP